MMVIDAAAFFYTTSLSVTVRQTESGLAKVSLRSTFANTPPPHTCDG